MNLFLDSILFPWSKYLSLCQCHSPDHRSLVVNLKQGVWALSFWLSFSRWGLLGPLHFHINFRIHLSPSFTISQSLLKLMSIESVMLSNRLNLCHPLLLLPSIFPTSGSFLMSQIFASGGQSIGASASASVLPMNIQDWFPLGLTDLISLLSQGLSRIFSRPQVKSINSSVLSLHYGPTLTSVQDSWKNHSFD